MSFFFYSTNSYFYGVFSSLNLIFADFEAAICSKEKLYFAVLTVY